MRTKGYANDALRFALELAALAAFAYWGVVTGGSLAVEIALAAGLPIVAATLWGVFLSPKARLPLRGTPRVLAELAYFGAATAALADAGLTILAAIFGGLALIHLVAHHAGIRGPDAR
jgi:hypothetical protein